jgi:hypothetical protein
VDAKAAAWACTHGSPVAWLRSTSCRIVRKRGFSIRESGVGGSLLVLPIARLLDGGDVGSSVRMCDVEEDSGSGKTCCGVFGWYLIYSFIS